MKSSESVAEVLELVSGLNFSFQRGTPKYWLHTGMGEKVEESQNTGFNKEALIYSTAKLPALQNPPNFSNVTFALFLYFQSLCI